MKKLHRLIAINQLSKKKTTWVHDNIFRILRNEDLWILAYENLKKSKACLASGIDRNDRTDSVSLKGLNRLKLEVCSEGYLFKQVDITQMPIPDDRRRFIGPPTVNDRIVQEVIRLILEAIYEPIFLPLSFGFRGRRCHEALKHVENNFRWVDWVIEREIEQDSPIVDYYVLVKCLSERIKDQRFISLIWKLLRCGIFEYDKQPRSDFGIPQGTFITAILLNIYYHELDEHINKVVLNFSVVCPSKRRHQEYQILEHKIAKIYEKVSKSSKETPMKALLMKEIKNVRLERIKRPSLLNSTIRIEYVRYADDWMIGISGEKASAERIKSDITDFIKRHLKQQAHFIKPKLTNISEGNSHFLGYNFFLPKEGKLSYYPGTKLRTIRHMNPILRMDAPVKNLIKRYIKKGYVLSTKKGIRPISRGSYASFQDHTIVSHYRSIILGLLNYYSGCTNPGRIQYLQYILQMSCAMTLGHRHRVSSSEVFYKHGKNLSVKVENTRSTVEITLKTKWLLSDKIWRIKSIPTSSYTKYKNIFSYSTIGFNCLICDSMEKIKRYHVKYICEKGFKDFRIHERVALLNRKHVPLCVCCHNRVTWTCTTGRLLKFVDSYKD